MLDIDENNSCNMVFLGKRKSTNIWDIYNFKHKWYCCHFSIGKEGNENGGW